MPKTPATPAPSTAPAPVSYEAAMQELEALVAGLEGGQFRFRHKEAYFNIFRG